MLAGPRATHQNTRQGSLQSSMMDECATNNVWSADGTRRGKKKGGAENDVPRADVRGEERSVCAGLTTCGSEGGEQ